MTTGRVEQVTAIHRFNIMENRTGLFLVAVIASFIVFIIDPLSIYSTELAV